MGLALNRVIIADTVDTKVTDGDVSPFTTSRRLSTSGIPSLGVSNIIPVKKNKSNSRAIPTKVEISVKTPIKFPV